MASTFAQSNFLLSGTQKMPSQCMRICPQSIYRVSLPKTRRQEQKTLIRLRKRKVVKAVAASVASSPLDNVEHRERLCQSYGFSQIGECLPDDVTLRDIIGTLPKKVFEIDDVKAWKSVLISLTSYALGIFMIAKAQWYLLPLAWAWTGTAITGVSFAIKFSFTLYYIQLVDPQ